VTADGDLEAKKKKKDEEKEKKVKKGRVTKISDVSDEEADGGGWEAVKGGIATAVVSMQGTLLTFLQALYILFCVESTIESGINQPTSFSHCSFSFLKFFSFLNLALENSLNISFIEKLLSVLRYCLVTGKAPLPSLRCRLITCGLADAPTFPKPHHLLTYQNPEWFLPFWCRLMQAAQKRGCQMGVCFFILLENALIPSLIIPRAAL